MSSLKVLYSFVILATLTYFLLYGALMKKLPVLTTSFGENSNYAQAVAAKYAYLPADSQDLIPKLQHTSSIELSPSMQGPKQDTSIPKETSNFLLSFLQGFGHLPREDNSSEQNTVTDQAPSAKPRGTSLLRIMKDRDIYLQEKGLSEDEPCPTFQEVGKIELEIENVTSAQIESELYFVEKGGHWKPNQCMAKRKVAIVIPFRNRKSHLNIFLRHMHPFLKLQFLDYRIFVVEQAGEDRFNRGMLMNIGFTEALKTHNFSCVVFHDVDLLPEDTRNDYSCPSSPRHMSTAVDTMDYELKYRTLFGGVEGFWTEHFLKVNGFPNRYWGWGGEDDDLYIRVTERNLGLTRPARMIGSYRMLNHAHKDSDSNPDRHNELNQALQYINSDGLNSLSYDLLSYNELPLYTMITVQPLNPPVRAQWVV